MSALNISPTPVIQQRDNTLATPAPQAAVVNITPAQTIPPVQPVKRGETKQAKLDDNRSRKEYVKSLQERNRGNSHSDITEDQISVAVRGANKALEWAKRHFEYSVHDATNSIVVRVYNSETEELIREIPPERILDLMARLWDLAGLVVDEKV